MTITIETLCSAFPTAHRENLDKFYSGIIDTFEKYNINTPARQAMFLAQVAHESALFSAVEENLNYSARALASVWPSRFMGVEDSYARNPEKIANRAYCDRMGNGNEQSGDGWKYRGRGLIQLTGAINYAAAGAALGADFINCPHLLSENPMAVLSAGWYWDTRQLNLPSDQHDVEAVTRAINGGVHGLEDRRCHFERIFSILESAGS